MAPIQFGVLLIPFQLMDGKVLPTQTWKPKPQLFLIY